MVITFSQHNKGEEEIGFDFSSSRHILITCGWLMAISDFFSKIEGKLILKKMDLIYKPKPLNLASFSKK